MPKPTTPDPQEASAAPCQVCGKPTSSRYGICSRTPECRRLASRAYYQANREAVAERQKAYRQAHRDEIRLRNFAHGRQKTLFLREELRGLNHPNWSGGRYVYCAICGAPAGWRTPSALKRVKHGFLCRHHRYRQTELKRSRE